MQAEQPEATIGKDEYGCQSLNVELEFASTAYVMRMKRRSVCTGDDANLLLFKKYMTMPY